MATGDTDDIVCRLKSLIPPGWIGDPSPIADAVLTGIASVLSVIYGLFQFSELQTRISTATGGWLDLISLDFFGTGLPRGAGQSDDSFRAEILANLFVKANTKAAISAALTTLTGTPPRIIELFNPGDCGAWDEYSYWDVDVPGAPARYAEPEDTAQFLVETVFPAASLVGTAPVAAFDSVASFDEWTGWFADLNQTGLQNETSVYALLNRLKVEGVIAWVKFVPAVPQGLAWDAPGIFWDSDEFWDV